MNKQLTKMAKLSPKLFAEQILKRNKSLLKKLMLLKPYVGHLIFEIPDHITSIVIKPTHFGCPHCIDDCRKCLWTKVYSDPSNDNCIDYCFDAPFPVPHKRSITLDEIRKQQSLIISYKDNLEEINFVSELFLLRDDWQNCVDFVKSHIEWAKLPCWGEKTRNYV